jgi:cell division protein FtsN
VDLLTSERGTVKARVTTALLVCSLLVFGAGGAIAATGHVTGAANAKHQTKSGKKAKKAKKHHRHHAARKHHAAAPAPSTATRPAAATEVSSAPAADSHSAAAQEYGTRPGKGCGDKNHDHTGPPGNPSNTGCPHKP